MWVEVIRCVYSSSVDIYKAFLHFRLWSGERLFTLSSFAVYSGSDSSIINIEVFVN